MKKWKELYPKGFDIMERKWNWNGQGLGRTNIGSIETVVGEVIVPQGTIRLGYLKRQRKWEDGSEQHKH